LIAVGLCRHRKTRSGSPAALLRSALTPALLRRLDALQPPHGGFLEAVPLSAFVAMALASCGLARHRVTQRALRFLLASQRPDDGSWPIDTNLDTWVTSLAVQAFGTREQVADCLDDPQALDALLRYLLRTQHRDVHPYTQAHPGGWAWTDPPGAVPDADDTAGALVAVSVLCPAGHPLEPEALRAARDGLAWLARIQNADGGIPTFCRGWGRLPFDRSAADLTAHAVEALAAWLPRLSAGDADRFRGVLARCLRFLLRTQAPEGTWLPLWFGTQATADGGNPIFGTARVVKALAPHADVPQVRAAIERARAWLRGRQNPDGSWGQSLHAATGTAEETGMALCALETADPGRAEAEAWVLRCLASGCESSPIGLYFARLWYSEALYPAIWLTAGLRPERP
jgi:squalene-hopene/tetraprenyl-beta-curcumene cyclase